MLNALNYEYFCNVLTVAWSDKNIAKKDIMTNVHKDIVRITTIKKVGKREKNAKEKDRK